MTDKPDGKRRRLCWGGGTSLDNIVPLPVLAGILMLIAGAIQLVAAPHAIYRRDSANQPSGLQRYRTMWIVSGVSLTLMAVAVVLLHIQEKRNQWSDQHKTGTLPQCQRHHTDSKIGHDRAAPVAESPASGFSVRRKGTFLVEVRPMEDTAAGPLRLSFASKQQVVVIPENEDRFLTTSRAAAQACQQAERLREWEGQFKEFLGFINTWCQEHEQKVRSCFVTVGDHSLNVLVFIRGDDYNFDLDDELADLDLALFERYPVCSADVLQVPNQQALTEQLLPSQTSPEALMV
jgi:hypothetical protein